MRRLDSVDTGTGTRRHCIFVVMFPDSRLPLQYTLSKYHERSANIKYTAYFVFISCKNVTTGRRKQALNYIRSAHTTKAVAQLFLFLATLRLVYLKPNIFANLVLCYWAKKQYYQSKAQLFLENALMRECSDANIIARKT